MVATPIGNLEDITLAGRSSPARGRRWSPPKTPGAPASCFGISEIATPLLSVHEHNERRVSTAVLDRLAHGESVALVSDAGTPGISDPGATLVARCAAAGIHGGADSRRQRGDGRAFSAPDSTASRFTFAGFPPVRAKDRKLWLAQLGRGHEAAAAVVAFEAPHRISQTRLTEHSIVRLNDQLLSPGS